MSLLLVSCVFIFSCSDTDKNGKVLSTTSSGEIKVSADETFMSIVDAEKQVFEVTYPKAQIHVTYKPETEVFNDFLNDSAILIVASRELNEQELAYFKKIQITTRSSRIATDAVTFVINKSNPDSNITVDQIKELLKGEITSWGNLNPKSKLGKIIPVFDNKSSSTVRYLTELAGMEKLETSDMYAFKSNEEVIDYVSKTPNAIGIIGVNWISDRDDSSAITFKNNITVMGVKAEKGEKGDDSFYQPYQAYIATGQYALTRSVYTISREPRTGLATGFASFIAGDKGQRIILKSGLVPTMAPIRIVEFK